MEDCEERGPFGFLKPNRLVDTVKVESQEALRCFERAVPLA